jgi:hypothetical protein
LKCAAARPKTSFVVSCKVFIYPYFAINSWERREFAVYGR